jgi:tripeptidyl-peptidase-1
MFAYGTSAAAPVFAGQISLINSVRERVGLPSVGFVNPALYANSKKFQDVTKGSNKCCANYRFPSPGICCSSGFTASKGYDPLSGLGNINFPNLLQILFPTSPSPTESPILSEQDTNTTCC